MWNSKTPRSIELALRVLKSNQDSSYFAVAYRFGLDPDILKNDIKESREPKLIISSCCLTLASYLTWLLTNSHVITSILAILALIVFIIYCSKRGVLEAMYERDLERIIAGYIHGKVSEDEAIRAVMRFQEKSAALVLDKKHDQG